MFEEVFEPIDELSEKINYWLVRTDSGNYYDYYYNRGFIAIGWNYITLQDLQNLSLFQLNQKIAKNEDLLLDETKGLKGASTIRNKLLKFKNLKKGDVVVITSESSKRLAFGIVADEKLFTEVNEVRLQEVDFFKRRKVRWYAEHSIHRLDPEFYKMVHTHHALSNINGYDKYIDRVMHSIYKKKGFAHISLEVKTNDDVDVDTLVLFMGALQKLIILINENFKFEEDVKENSIRLNIQSPGIMEMKLRKGSSLMMLAVVLNVMSCGNMDNIQGTPQQKQEIEQFINQNDSLLDTIRHGVNEMEVDMSRFNNIY